MKGTQTLIYYAQEKTTRTNYAKYILSCAECMKKVYAIVNDMENECNIIGERRLRKQSHKTILCTECYVV